MKKLLSIFTFLVMFKMAFPQAPQLLNYQAIVRDGAGIPVRGTPVNFQFQVHDVTQSGNVVFTETDTATTNQFGLAMVQIGKNSSLSGVSWGSDNKYLQVDIDITGGSNFVDMGTSQLLSVPYALYSGNGAANSWGLNGDSGTIYGTNFIGTTDSVNLMFRVKNTPAGRIETFPSANTSFGIGALIANTGTYNSSFGAAALNANTTASFNTAVGVAALRFHASGNSNTAIGDYALYTDTSGTDNTASGFSALYSNISGIKNTATGMYSLYHNTTGDGSAAFGYKALSQNATGYSNVAIGISALYSNTSLSNQVAIGDSALYSNNGGTGGNTAIGSKGLYANTTGYANTATGYQALNSNITGNNNTATGANALQSNATGSNNSVYGYNAMLLNRVGSNNTASGINALSGNVYGSGNTAIGCDALAANDQGNNNVAIGAGALHSDQRTYEQVAVGDSALYNHNSVLGAGNTAVGGRALFANINGSGNTALGFEALSNDSGRNNTAVGSQSLNNNINGQDNTALGQNADVASGGLFNATAIGYNATVDSSNKVLIGNTSVVSIGGQVHWTTFSDERVKTRVTQNVPGLAFIKLLQPVTYHYDINKENQLMGLKNANNEWEGKHDIEKIAFSGFIAQQVDGAAKSAGYDFSGVDKHGSIWGLRYSEFVPSIVKSVQEIDSHVELQETIISALQQQVADLKRQNADMQRAIEDLKKK